MKTRLDIFPKLQPSRKVISLRLPIQLINQVKTKANEMDVPYQSLMKIYIAEGLEKEFRKKQPKI